MRAQPGKGQQEKDTKTWAIPGSTETRDRQQAKRAGRGLRGEIESKM